MFRFPFLKPVGAFALAALLLSIAGCTNNGMAPPNTKSMVSYTSLYSFKGGTDGADPEAGLIAMNGALYGTTKYGGGRGHCFHRCGTVFEMSTLGKERVLYRFRSGNDGANPVAGLIAVSGELYGTTKYGGGSCDRGNYSCDNGTVFKVSTSGKELVLYGFGGPYEKGRADGALPLGGLVAVNGELYGTTSSGGDCAVVFCQAGGDGVVFEVSTAGDERVLYSFGPRKSGTQGVDDGIEPVAGLVAVNGLLYGTTQTGSGTATLGTVYQVSTSGVERVLYRFKGTEKAGPDGALPQADLVAADGMLYGTTLWGGDGSCHPACGIAFQVSTAGVERVFYRFKGGSDGAYSQAGLTSLNGVLFGTTRSGGARGFGTVFALSSSGTERVLYSFKGGTDGAYPDAGVVALSGVLYGTTGYGGSYGKGTIFKLTP